MAKSMNWFTQLGVKSSVAFSLWEFSSFGVTFTWSQLLSPWKTHREAQQDSDLDDDDNEEEEFIFTPYWLTDSLLKALNSHGKAVLQLKEVAASFNPRPSSPVSCHHTPLCWAALVAKEGQQSLGDSSTPPAPESSPNSHAGPKKWVARSLWTAVCSGCQLPMDSRASGTRFALGARSRFKQCPRVMA